METEIKGPLNRLMSLVSNFEMILSYGCDKKNAIEFGLGNIDLVIYVTLFCSLNSITYFVRCILLLYDISDTNILLIFLPGEWILVLVFNI